MRRLSIAVLVLGTVSACGTVPTRSAWPDRAVELASVPFFPQAAYQCGPAALATVLTASGYSILPEALVEQVYLPARQGSLQAEMLAAVRRAGRLPLLLAPEFSAVARSVEAGYPVLVLQNLGVSWWPQWHYAVVIGTDPERQQVLLRSGTEDRKVQGIRRFMNTWDRSERWAVVVAQADQVPDGIGMQSWLMAAQSLLEAQQPGSALVALETAARHWPSRALPWLLLGNLHYQQGSIHAAADAFYRARSLEPGSVAAANNLASVLIELNCAEPAARLLEDVARMTGGGRLSVTLAQTREELERARQSSERKCQWTEPAS